MDFKYDDPIEICKKEEGFSGIYYKAKYLAAMGSNKYLVRYDTRLTEDGYSPIVEAVDADEIRPLPPKSAHNIVVSDKVDAYVNLAWRVGTVIRKVDSNYHVKLDCDGKEAHCAFYNVRLHHEWRDGSWFDPESGSQSSQASTSAQGGQPATEGSIADTGDQGTQPKNEGD
ncbi:PREDICTED: DUF724 domain-containing protein 2 [Theobroma cacao]|uniref:DUF724 domain-containing protein 2 n=1 Tax=Theobroma cacao TaxID=3641 RepID=A0AB32V1A0_THECC|nr:PREDICTED: DUF724 domain-containing protein 2 [Theobroma cacao]